MEPVIGIVQSSALRFALPVFIFLVTSGKSLVKTFCFTNIQKPVWTGTVTRVHHHYRVETMGGWDEEWGKTFWIREPDVFVRDPRRNRGNTQGRFGDWQEH